MSVARLEFLQLVQNILDIEKEAQNIFTDQGISYIRKLLNKKYGKYQFMADRKLSKLLPICMDQINIFCNWHQLFSSKNSIYKDS